MGARLARYTGNETYAKRAEQAWDWLVTKQYIDRETWNAYDGAHVETNCTDVNKATFSYNAAVLTQGAAFMYNYVSLYAESARSQEVTRILTTMPQTNGDAKWKKALDGLLGATLKTFFAPDNIAHEIPCEGKQGKSGCTPDMLSYKGYTHRWLAVAAQLAPYTKNTILPVLRTSAEAAIKQCTGGASQRQCGFYWSFGQFIDPAGDKTTGAGEQMNVLAAVSSLLIEKVGPPVTNSTGGTSRGNPNAGGKDNGEKPKRPITSADKAGAGFVTFLLLVAGLGMFVWMSAFD
jgi:mannan endo-1,6-alpha-mannosidase